MMDAHNGPFVTPRNHLGYQIYDDPNLVSYAILLLLSVFKCESKENEFVDILKTRYIIELITSPVALRLIIELQHQIQNDKLSPTDSRRVQMIISRSISRVNTIKLAYQALLQNQLIHVWIDDSGSQSTTNVYITENGSKMLKCADFSDEIERIFTIKKHIPKLRTIKSITLATKLFGHMAGELCLD